MQFKCGKALLSTLEGIGLTGYSEVRGTDQENVGTIQYGKLQFDVYMQHGEQRNITVCEIHPTVACGEAVLVLRYSRGGKWAVTESALAEWLTGKFCEKYNDGMSGCNSVCGGDGCEYE
jgi:hypothetical protein